MEIETVSADATPKQEVAPQQGNAEASSAPAKTASENIEESETSKQQGQPSEDLPQEDDSDDQDQGDSSEHQDDANEKISKVVKKRLERLRRQKDREIDFWKAEALKVKGQNPEPKEQAPQKQEAKPASNDGKPKEEDFGTPAEYLEALVEWKDSQRERAAYEKAMKESAQNGFNKHLERIDNFRKATPDYDKMIGNFTREMGADFQFQPVVFEAITASENGPELLYEIAKDPEKAERLNGLSPAGALLEIGRMEARVSLAKESSKLNPPKKITNAPPPVSPIGSSNTAPTKTPDQMTPDEYMAWRRSQKRK